MSVFNMLFGNTEFLSVKAQGHISIEFGVVIGGCGRGPDCCKILHLQAQDQLACFIVVHRGDEEEERSLCRNEKVAVRR
jgi:hypothetical protein